MGPADHERPGTNAVKPIGSSASRPGPIGFVLTRRFDRRFAADADLERLADRLGLLEAGALVLARADDPEAARSEVGVGDDRQPADLLPAEPLDLEGVHPHLGGGPWAAGVVLVDRFRDRLEVLRLGAAAHGRSVVTAS